MNDRFNKRLEADLQPLSAQCGEVFFMVCMADFGWVWHAGLAAGGGHRRGNCVAAVNDRSGLSRWQAW